MELGIKGKRGIVCAASKGIGRACAEGLAKEGVQLVICSRKEEEIKKAADEISAVSGTKVVPVVADMSAASGTEKLVSACMKELGGVDILVNNAGGPPPGGFDDFDDEAYYKAFEQNFMSIVRLIRLVLPYMKEQKWGRIINIESVSVKQPVKNLLLSNAIRPGVIGLTKTVSDNVAKYGVTMNSVAPNAIHTDRIDQILKNNMKLNGTTYDEEYAEYVRETPAGRMGKPEEVAAMVCFLASERAGFITGSTIAVDGGTIRSIF